jgi:hypothetical protein
VVLGVACDEGSASSGAGKGDEKQAEPKDDEGDAESAPKKKAKADTDPKPGADEKPGALLSLPQRKVAAGESSTGAFTPTFELVRFEGDEGKGYLEAWNACAAQHLALCSDAQWSKACADDEKVGKLESWIVDATTAGVLVRGGDGCATRKTVLGSEASKTRVGLCCSHAPPIVSTNKNDVFRSTVSAKLAELEKANDDHDVKATLALFTADITYYGKVYDPPEIKKLFETHYAAHADQQVVYTSCDVSFVESMKVSRWSATCTMVSQRAKQVAVVLQKLDVGVSTGGWFNAIGETKTIRAYAAP